MGFLKRIKALTPIGIAGKNWHGQRRPSRPQSGWTSYDTRRQRDTHMAAAQERERAMKAAQEAERQV
jgi:hypothetical protein